MILAATDVQGGDAGIAEVGAEHLADALRKIPADVLTEIIETAKREADNIKAKREKREREERERKAANARTEWALHCAEIRRESEKREMERRKEAERWNASEERMKFIGAMLAKSNGGK